jgi:hypothetical protein
MRVPRESIAVRGEWNRMRDEMIDVAKRLEKSGKKEAISDAK